MAGYSYVYDKKLGSAAAEFETIRLESTRGEFVP